ncbi:M23 family metallopeptidase [Bacillaceae bacterium S4-13-58]
MSNEEKNNVSKFPSWKRLSRKKWFFPAVYLTLAAIILSGVLVYQNNQETALDGESTNNGENTSDNGDSYNYYDDNESTPVIEQEENLSLPVGEGIETEIVTKFYDYDASEEDQRNALVFYNNRYYQSSGIDISRQDGESFDVTAALSGTVVEVKEDPLLGYVVTLSHDNGITTHYASLEDVTLQAGSEVRQGETIGTAGRNLFGQASGTHVHFEVWKDDVQLNPETFINKPVSDIQAPEVNDAEDRESNLQKPASGTQQELGQETDVDTDVDTNTESSISQAQA